ncbi:hypothetical protein C2E23DRAFT_881783 [Lenzites betulinus]|nr:hypothetical protein C2E23DRAFT_881783 [Lenzites betulinus]
MSASGTISFTAGDSVHLPPSIPGNCIDAASLVAADDLVNRDHVSAHADDGDAAFPLAADDIANRDQATQEQDVLEADAAQNALEGEDDGEDADVDEDEHDEDPHRAQIQLSHEAWDALVLPNHIGRYYVTITAVRPDGEVLTSHLFIPGTLDAARGLSWEFWNTAMDRVRERFGGIFKPSQSDAIKTIAYVLTWFAHAPDVADGRDVRRLWYEMLTTFEGMGVMALFKDTPGDIVLYNLRTWAQARIEASPSHLLVSHCLIE